MADKKISQLSNASTPLAGTETLPIVQSGSTVKVAVANLTEGRAVNCAGVNAFGESYLAGPDVNNALRAVRAGSAIYLQVSNGGVAGDLHLGNWYGNGFLQVLSTGNVTVSTGNLVQGTAAKGINFTANTPAAGMTSQLLNWYEEGTWTPVLTFTTPGDLAVTYTTQAGTYTRIGNRVIMNFQVLTSSFTHTTAAGTLRLTGLPFTSANVTGTSSVGSCSWSGITNASFTQCVPVIDPNTSIVGFQLSGSGQLVASVTPTDMPTGGTVLLRGTITYMV